MKVSTIVKPLSQSIALASLLAVFGGAVQAMEITVKDVDLNADGMVTEGEILNVVKMHFMMMDKDGDHQVSAAEWLAADNAER